MDDAEVMAAVREGDADALGLLYGRYCDRAYRVAWSVCRDDGRAEEAVQETFISIWNSRRGYRECASVAPWVLSVARHRAIDVARRNAPHAAHRASDDLLHAAQACDRVAEQVVRDAQARDVLGLLAELPDEQREVIALAFYGQLTHHEIAAHLDVPLGTVKGRMRLGMQRLRGHIIRALA